jgi:hypothetical protein
MTARALIDDDAAVLLPRVSSAFGAVLGQGFALTPDFGANYDPTPAPS